MTQALTVPAKLTRGAQIGAGGEGKVFAVAGVPNLALKVYHRAPSAQRVEKLKAMADMARPELLAFTAWPLKVLGGTDQGSLGVAMPMVRDAREINLAYAPKARAKHFPEADWRFLVRVATNVAAAFANIHETGCVIGDVNQSSVLVRANATIALIDCDSFQLEHGGALYPCEVAVPTFTPPELQGSDPSAVRRTPDHDAFGLAVLIFLLLFMGRHPYAGRPHGGEDLPIEKAIAARQFAYARSRRGLRLDPPPNSLLLSDLPASIADLFEQALGLTPQPRPRAEAWHRALTGLERGLRTCRIEPTHAFSSSLSHCPWCAIERTTGATLFKQTPVAQKSSPLVTPPDFPDTEDLWAPVEVALQNRLPRIPPRVSGTMLSPSPAVAALLKARRRDLWKSAGVMLSTGILGALGAGVPVAFASPVAVAAGLGAMRLLHRKRREELTKLREAYEAALAEREALEQDWATLSRQCTSNEYASLMRAHDQYETLARPWLKLRESTVNAWRQETHRWKSRMSSEAKRIRRQLETMQRLKPKLSDEELVATHRAQLKAHLDAHLISSASIDQIGPSRIATLRSFQIETAADVTKKSVQAVPGFGTFLAKKLLGWRSEVERAFVFDVAVAKAALREGVITASAPPAQPGVPSLPQRTVDVLRALEVELRAAPARIAQSAAQTRKTLSQLAVDAERAAQDLAQAEADLSAAEL